MKTLEKTDNTGAAIRAAITTAVDVSVDPCRRTRACPPFAFIPFPLSWSAPDGRRPPFDGKL